jgi:hypothetical protein
MARRWATRATIVGKYVEALEAKTAHQLHAYRRAITRLL